MVFQGLQKASRKLCNTVRKGGNHHCESRVYKTFET